MIAVADRAEVLGCEIDRIDMAEAARRCDGYVRTRAGAQHMAVNAAKIVAMRHDAALRGLVDACELITADGQAVVWASRLLGDPLPVRVAGIDLMHELLALAERGVLADSRGVWLRLGPAPYLSDRQLERAMALLGDALSAVGGRARGRAG